jgi:hypothetical protein
VSVGEYIIGYVSKTQNSYGEYIGVSPDDDSSDVKHRLLVEYNATKTGPQSLVAQVSMVKSQFSILLNYEQNGPDNTFPFFGAIQGPSGVNLGNTSK